MKPERELISLPVSWIEEGTDVAELIERDPEAFREGRRNDDVVNWWLAKRIKDLKDHQMQTCYMYQAEFSKLILTEKQTRDLNRWSDNPAHKLEVMFQHYGHITEPERLEYFWIPQDYLTPVPASIGMTPML